ncbi:MAG: beta-ketoacyl synthase chain length factor, partial [Gammaproteobacteria bacterium]|nr:beta-ketoacyl synthase chain length factor [Gammaproteobacteria bacterium]
SVHNAPSGYWAIAAKSSMPSTSISTGNSTFASGLLEAVTQLLSSGEDILYVAYDYPPVEPSPLVKFIDVSQPFAVAFILSLNKNTQNAGMISLKLQNEVKEKSLCVNSSLNELQQSNPVANSLPLLEALYLKKATQLYIPFLNNTLLQVDVSQ